MDKKELIQRYCARLANAVYAIAEEERAADDNTYTVLVSVFREAKQNRDRKNTNLEGFLKALMAMRFGVGNDSVGWILTFFGQMEESRPEVFGPDGRITKPHIFAAEFINALSGRFPVCRAPEDFMPETSGHSRSTSLQDIKAQLKDRMEKSYNKGVGRAKMILEAVEGEEICDRYECRV